MDNQIIERPEPPQKQSTIKGTRGTLLDFESQIMGITGTGSIVKFLLKEKIDGFYYENHDHLTETKQRIKKLNEQYFVHDDKGKIKLKKRDGKERAILQFGKNQSLYDADIKALYQEKIDIII